MEKVIIGIHGLANKPKPEILKDWWRKSILEGLHINLNLNPSAIPFNMVYWADLLYRVQQHNEVAYNFDQLYNNEPYIGAAKGSIEEYKEKLRDEIRAKILGIFGSGLDVLKQRFDLDFLGDWVLEKVMKDLAFYYDDERKIQNRSGIMQIASKVLKDELIQELEKHQGKEIMLIAHSMGSIIAYDVLRDLGHQPGNEIYVKHFITIGSPLGLPYVKHKINDERVYDKMKNKVRTPSIVTGDWINYADKKDPVALDFYLKDDYGENAAGIKVKDDMILNDYVGLSGKRNHHKSYGYLRTPEMSTKIADFLSL